MQERPPYPLVTREPTRRQLIGLDAVLVVGYALVIVWPAVLRPAGGTTAAALPTWVLTLLAGAATAPLVARRRWPVAVLCLVGPACLVALVVGLRQQPFLPAAFALYPVALTQPSRRWISTRLIAGLCAGTALVGMTVGVPGWSPGRVGSVVAGIVLLGASWTVGRAVRERRAHAAWAAEQRARQAVAEERLRIARELHDVVAHSMGVIAVKAGVANHVLRVRPQEAHDALRVIEETSRQALTELRATLGVLRTDAAVAGTDDRVPTAAPTPADLDDLAARSAMLGVRVRLEVRGWDRLPAGIGLAVYRIVQEALTNVGKHAAPAGCRVLGAVDAEAVTVEVVDDGPGTRVLPRSPGLGLIGMRERVMMYGGTFAAGPDPAGGFRVAARIPLVPEHAAVDRRNGVRR